jgi:hypothetical protein
VIAWAVPAAFAGLVLLAGPVLVHMLLRRNARRLVFPTTRFFEVTRAAAVRFQRPSDIGLLLLRCGIVLAAVLAATQPTLLATWRTARWNERIARAVIVDTSRSMPSPQDAARLADQEMNAFSSARFESADLRDAIRRAGEWIARTAPARREIVIVSDFQRGAIDVDAFAAVPAGVGLRFIRAGTRPPQQEVPLPAISGWRGTEWQGSAVVRGDSTEVTWKRSGASKIGWLSTRQADADTEAAARAVAGVSSFGVAPGDESHRVVVAFAGAATAVEQPVETEWMLRAEAALRRSAMLRQSGASIRTAEQDGTFVVHASVAAADAMAPAVVRAVMLAVRPASIADREAEVVTVPDAELARWRREAGPVGPRVTMPPDAASDARWLWATALLLLGIEGWIRRSKTRGSEAGQGNVSNRAA